MAKFFSFAHARKLILPGLLLSAALLPVTAFAYDLANLPADIGKAILGVVASFVLTFSGWILGIVGVLFNWVIIKTVFQFGTYFGTTDGMLIAWGVMRDVANIGLLFSFIFMGVLLILNVEGGGHGHGGGISAKRAIPRLIIFAVLLNFSLFATQGIIDVANAFGSQFAGLAGMECTGVDTTDTCANKGIASKVLQMAGIQTIWSEGVSPDGVVLLGLALFVIITAMVLLAASIMLIIRVVVLTLLMVTSPIGFAGMVIPGLSGLASKWWHALLSQSFFAPVMLLLMFISLKMAESLNPNKVALVNAFVGSNGQSAGNLEIVVVFAVVIGLMLASLAIASKMGAIGAGFATSTASKLTVGSVGFVGRRTLGAASGGIANRIASSNYARNNGFGSQFAHGVFSKGAASSYSLRTGLNSGTKGMGIDMGNASKEVSHGIHGIEEAKIKAKVKFADETIKQSDDEKKAEERLKNDKKITQNSKAIEQASYKRDSSEMQKGIDETAEENTAQSSRRLQAIDDQKTKIQDEKNKIKLGSSSAQVLAREEAVLKTMVDEHRRDSEQERADIENRKRDLRTRKEAHDEAIAEFDARVKDIDQQIEGGEVYDPSTGATRSYTGVSKDAARRTFGEALGRGGLLWPSVGNHVNHEASEKILKKLSRSDNEKLVDAIKDSRSSGGGGGSHGGGGGGG
ncbi:hypothetical protein KJ848_00410, partial [Patescibacteria group bacterium]|nr:hypothetical protein [Patescibacteria group bacterium]